MISLDSLTSAATGSGSAYGSGQNELHRNGWLLELERAWLNSESGSKNASQPRTDPRAPSSTAHDDGASSEEKPDEAPRGSLLRDTTGLLSAAPTFSGGTAISASSPQPDSYMLADASGPLRQSSELPPPANQLPIGGRPVNVAIGMALAGSARFAASEQSSSSRMPGELSPAENSEGSNAMQASTESDASYSERRLHFLEDERGVRVWIRDAALSEARGHAVAEALRGELGAAGLRVVAMALNGRKISGHGDPLPEPGTISVRQDTDYVRSMIDESNLSIGKLSQKEHS